MAKRAGVHEWGDQGTRALAPMVVASFDASATGDVQ